MPDQLADIELVGHHGHRNRRPADRFRPDPHLGDLMTDTTPTTADLLRQAETYLTVTHDHAGRHDTIGADLTCAGCQLRTRVTAALLAPARLVLGTTDQQPATAPADTELRDRIAQALSDEDVHSCQMQCAVDYRALADAVLAVLPAPTNPAAVLNERADFLEGCLRDAADPGSDPRYWTAVRDVAMGLRRMADEAQQPDTIGLCGACGDPREGHHHGYERTPHVDDEAQQPETEAACAHCGSVGHVWDDCEVYAALVRETEPTPGVAADEQPETEAHR